MGNSQTTPRDRARAIRSAGGIAAAVHGNGMGQFTSISLSESLVLGLLAQGVRTYVAVFGHGSTDVANILDAYESEGLLRTCNVRSEVEASHCATMLRWHYGESAAVVTSIGPGAHQALAASLVPASNGVGVYYICGDETTHAEGPNMQAIPTHRQHSMLAMVNAMASGYCLHTPSAVFSALRFGAATVFHPTRPGPFFFLLPLNTQPEMIPDCNLLELCGRPQFPSTTLAEESALREATRMVKESRAITIKYGGGARGCGPEIQELAQLIDAVIVSGAGESGLVPYSNMRFMAVGGSKGSLCGNFAMENADLAIVIGARAVCQWDCSGTAWKQAKSVINFNSDPQDAVHYNRSVPILGHAKENLRVWLRLLREEGFAPRARESSWLAANRTKKREWEALKASRFSSPLLHDEVWDRAVLTQPAAIRIAWEFAREKRAACYFDAGDVQANGFQLIEDEEPGLTFSDTGSSYMGFAGSSLLASALAEKPCYTFAFSGDGSFIMNPQILVDGVEHGARGCIIVFDNRRMGAITGLQAAQYERGYRTSDSVAVDYAALASAVKGVKGIFGGYSTESFREALRAVYAHPGLSLIHVPVYWGSNELGGLGVYGSWNVGNWCEAVQAEHHRIGL
jgi:thiamine pyrophosphate-dependent acetolactate synthase large subunit-like protein